MVLRFSHTKHAHVGEGGREYHKYLVWFWIQCGMQCVYIFFAAYVPLIFEIRPVKYRNLMRHLGMGLRMFRGLLHAIIPTLPAYCHLCTLFLWILLPLPSLATSLYIHFYLILHCKQSLTSYYNYQGMSTSIKVS